MLKQHKKVVQNIADELVDKYCAKFVAVVGSVTRHRNNPTDIDIVSIVDELDMWTRTDNWFNYTTQKNKEYKIVLDLKTATETAIKKSTILCARKLPIDKEPIDEGFWLSNDGLVIIPFLPVILEPDEIINLQQYRLFERLKLGCEILYGEDYIGKLKQTYLENRKITMRSL